MLWILIALFSPILFLIGLKIFKESTNFWSFCFPKKEDMTRKYRRIYWENVLHNNVNGKIRLSLEAKTILKTNTTHMSELEFKENFKPFYYVSPFIIRS